MLEDIFIPGRAAGENGEVGLHLSMMSPSFLYFLLFIYFKLKKIFVYSF